MGRDPGQGLVQGQRQQSIEMVRLNLVAGGDRHQAPGQPQPGALGQWIAAAPAAGGAPDRRKGLLSAGRAEHTPIEAGGQGGGPLASEGTPARLFQARAEGLQEQPLQRFGIDRPGDQGGGMFNRIGPVARVDRIEDEHRIFAVEAAPGRFVKAADRLLQGPFERVMAG